MTRNYSMSVQMYSNWRKVKNGLYRVNEQRPWTNNG